GRPVLIHARMLATGALTGGHVIRAPTDLRRRLSGCRPGPRAPVPAATGSPPRARAGAVRAARGAVGGQPAPTPAPAPARRRHPHTPPRPPRMYRARCPLPVNAEIPSRTDIGPATGGLLPAIIGSWTDTNAS